MRTSAWTVAAFVLLLVTGTARAQAAPCEFSLGFAELHELLSDIVGDCLQDEAHDPTTGDAVQQTTNGLLVWRKLDNWTAFTDGSQTWVNGPLGLAQRGNGERFWWEANADGLPLTPPPVPDERCHTAGLALSAVGIDAGAGNLVGTYRFTNQLDVRCTFLGYPGAQLLDAGGNPLPTLVVRGGGYFLSLPPPAAVSVGAHASAMVRVHWEQVPVGNEVTCSMAEGLALTPPDEFVPLTLKTQIRACGGGHLDVTPVLVETV